MSDWENMSKIIVILIFNQLFPCYLAFNQFLPKIDRYEGLSQILGQFFMLEAAGGKRSSCTVFTHNLEQNLLSHWRQNSLDFNFVNLEGEVNLPEFYDGYDPSSVDHNQLDMKVDKGCGIVVANGNDLELDNLFLLTAPIEDLTFYLLYGPQNSTGFVLNPKLTYKIGKIKLIEEKENGNGFWIHTMCPFGELQIRKDSWNQDHGFLFDAFSDCPPREAFEGKHLTVSIEGLSPWMIFTNDPELKPHQGLSGIDVQIASSLARHYHFEYSFRQEKNIGNFLGNGSWAGTTGSVADAVSDLGIGTINMVYSRNRALDFTSIVYAKEFSLLTRKPRPVDSFYKVVQPFTIDVWIAIGVMTLIMVVVFWVFFKLSIYQGHKTASPDFFHFLLDTPSMLYYPIEIKWYTQTRFSLSGSLLLTIWLFSGILLSDSYGGILRASLLAPEYEKPVDSFKDLWEQGRKGWMVMGTSLVSGFATSLNEYQRNVYNKALEDGTTYNGRNSPQYVVNDIVANGSAQTVEIGQFIGIANAYYEKYKIQPFRRTSEVWANIYSAFMIPKHAKIRKELFDVAIQHLFEAGIIKRYYRMFAKLDLNELDAVKSSDEEDSNEKKLDLTHYNSTFIFWGFFNTIALVIFAIELIRGHLCKK